MRVLWAIAGRREALGAYESSKRLLYQNLSAFARIHMIFYINTPLVRLSLQLLPLPLDMLLLSTFLWTTILGTIE